MGIEGTYGFVYCGNRGLGIGVFLVEGQRIEGRDFAGGRYMGAAVQDGKGNIQLDVQMQVPGGTAAQDLPHTRHIHWTFPPAFGDGEPQMGGVRRAGHSDSEEDSRQERRNRKKRVHPRNDGALGRVHHPLKRRSALRLLQATGVRPVLYANLWAGLASAPWPARVRFTQQLVRVLHLCREKPPWKIHAVT
jgi:hypothetical protein